LTSKTGKIFYNTELLIAKILAEKNSPYLRISCLYRHWRIYNWATWAMPSPPFGRRPKM